MSIRTLRRGESVPLGEPARYVNDAGYVRLRWKVGVEEYVEVYEHRMVAGMPPDEMEVHHINRVRDDNRPENLQVVTPPEHRDLHMDEWRAEWERRKAERAGCRSWEAYRKVRSAQARRESHARLVDRMRELYESGMTAAEVGREVGRDASRVSVHLRRAGVTMRTRWT